ncbi:unnamed protein product [Porites lobata]|uniref:Endonuclease/exonuclease/phosphatase domain-containing protein n=1 Tax=Porites lobata TaxID=104759 RepID=A0ABN8QCS1_9CNID|nr:unnamed protein product [Porites lobata]
MTGGVGIYISSSLNAIHRSHLSFKPVEAESCWIEILQEHKPSIIVGCICRHPSSNLDNFISQLENLVSPLNQSKHQVFILGDMNIDSFKDLEKTINEEFNHLLSYCSANKLSINFKKTHYMTVSSPQKSK